MISTVVVICNEENIFTYVSGYYTSSHPNMLLVELAKCLYYQISKIVKNVVWRISFLYLVCKVYFNTMSIMYAV